jgi:membrane-associated phospholipid phosphatase
MSFIQPHKRQAIVIGTVVYLAYIVFNSLIQDYLFELTKTFIPLIQNYLDHPFFQNYFYITAQLGNGKFVAVALGIYLVISSDKFNAFKLIFFVTSAAYIMSVMKSMFAAPRPYFEEPKIIAYEPYTEYGNPSGHCFVCIFSYGYLFYRYVMYQDSQNEDNNVEMRTNLADPTTITLDQPAMNYRKAAIGPWFTVIKIGYLFLLGSIAFGRMYLGMHSINQVLFGMVCGGFWLYMLIQCLENGTAELFITLIQKSFAKKHVMILILALSYMILSVIPIALYLNNVENNPRTSPTWTVWYPRICSVLKENFNKVCDEDHFAYNKVFLDCSSVGIPFGMLFGFLASKGYYDKYLMPTISRRQLVLRSLVYAVVGGVVVLGFLFIPKCDNLIARYIFNQNLFGFFGMFLVITSVPFINHKLGLEVKGDFLALNQYEVDDVEKNGQQSKGQTAYVEMMNTRT